jgi:hypothetical protein
MQSDDIGFREVKTMYVLFQCIIKEAARCGPGLEVFEQSLTPRR